MSCQRAPGLKWNSFNLKFASGSSETDVWRASEASLKPGHRAWPPLYKKGEVQAGCSGRLLGLLLRL